MGKKKNSLFKLFRSDYKIVKLIDDSLELEGAVKVSRKNILLFFAIILAILLAITIYVIAFTSVKEMIPGYNAPQLRRELKTLAVKTDSLEQLVRINDQYQKNLRAILEGKDPEPLEINENRGNNFQQPKPLAPSKSDSLLRKKVEREDRFNTFPLSSTNTSLERQTFFAPIEGIVTSKFDVSNQHFGIDIVAPENTTIKASLKGTVVFADWTSDSGYVLVVQHNDQLITIYKHNASLLKKVGEAVKSGEAIAIIGNSGELSSGPHLHFELWHQGRPLDPSLYVLFTKKDL